MTSFVPNSVLSALGGHVTIELWRNISITDLFSLIIDSPFFLKEQIHMFFISKSGD
jgi:hypothetical protein